MSLSITHIHKVIKAFVSGVVIISLCACKQPTSQVQSTTSGITVNATVVAPINVATPLADAALIDAVDTYLREKHQINSGDFKLKSIENVNWADACLGINHPDKLCAQVITPGFKLIFENQQRQLIIHTDTTGRRIVLANP